MTVSTSRYIPSGKLELMIFSDPVKLSSFSKTLLSSSSGAGEGSSMTLVLLNSGSFSSLKELFGFERLGCFLDNLLAHSSCK